MTRPRPPERLNWQLGTVMELVPETERVRSIVIELPAWPGHQPGQHVDVRLTAADGYQTQRSYSIASAPEDGYIVLTVARLEEGEVSPYLVDELRVGDQLELRGPIGGYFVLGGDVAGPVLLIAGGLGVAPFRSMLRHCVAAADGTRVRLLYSVRSWDEVVYAEELLRLAAYDEVDIRFTLTREWPDSWRGRRGRVDRRLLNEVSWPAAEQQLNFVCGASGFVEAVASALVELGQPPSRIRTERFGPTG